jgi:hypothetical protein
MHQTETQKAGRATHSFQTFKKRISKFQELKQNPRGRGTGQWPKEYLHRRQEEEQSNDIAWQKRY